MNKFSANFGAATRIVDGPWAIYPNSILFKAGEYPDKNFTATTDDIRAMVASFVPGDDVKTIAELKELASKMAAGPGSGNVEHTDFLAGRAARIRRVWADDTGETLLGEVAIPLVLDDLLMDSERRLSVEICDGPELCGIALTTSPRVHEAVLMSSVLMARHDTPDGQYKIQSMHDAACRHGAVCDKSNTNMASRHEATALQDMHDVAVKHGAKCASTGSSTSYYSDADTGRKDKKIMPTLKERVAAMFSRAGVRDDEEIDDAKFATIVGGTVPAPAPAATSTEVSDLRATIVKMTEDQRTRDAKAFADKIINVDKKALPREHVSIAAAHFQAATDDAAHPVKVTFANDKGEPMQGSRVDQLTALYAARTPHVLTEELLRDQLAEDAPAVMALFTKSATPNPEDPAKFSTRKKEELMAMTPLGTAIQNGKGN